MKRYLAIDYGLSKTGIAVTDPLKIVARDYEVIFEKDADLVIDRIGEICKKEKVELLILGLPLSLDGKKWSQAEMVEEFGENLKRLELPIKYVDERYSTKRAEEIMREKKMSNEEIAKRSDAVAASVFLQDYIDFN